MGSGSRDIARVSASLRQANKSAESSACANLNEKVFNCVRALWNRGNRMILELQEDILGVLWVLMVAQNAQNVSVRAKIEDSVFQRTS